MLATPFCRELGIDYPICSVGFGIGAGPELVSAVSSAGGLGVLGASGASPEDMRAGIAQVRKLTDRPFGVNVIIDEESEEDREFLRLAIAAASVERVGAVVLLGDPAPYVEEAHRHGVKVFIQVGSVAEAKAAAAVGIDVVIAQGFEAGGHVRGKTSIWELLPATVEAVEPVPVLASGGIGDGAGVARALRLGAGPDASHRTLRNKTFEEWDAAGRPPPGERPGEGTSIGKRRLPSGKVQEWPRYAVGMAPPDFEGDIEYAPLWAGESCSVVNDIKPAGQIVSDLVREAEEALRVSRGA
jgi:NAD(P)H-dependent flavin oxidoreductase YrpB (nitropropane dioxygenase family)